MVCSLLCRCAQRIRSRIAPVHYGWAEAIEVPEGIEIPQEIYKKNLFRDPRGRLCMSNVFVPIVKKDSSIRTGQEIKRGGLTPYTQDATVVMVELYSTAMDLVENQHECVNLLPGQFEKVGRLPLPCAFGQTMELSLQIGGTEITASAVNTTTNGPKKSIALQ